MRVLVYGAGVLGSIHAVRLHDAGFDVTLVARGARLASIRAHGVLIAEGDLGAPRSVLVPVTDAPTGEWDLTLVVVRTHQVDAVLDTIAGRQGDVLFLVNWAAGAVPLGDVIGADRVLLGFPTQGGTMDGDVVRHRPSSPMDRLVPMPIGEPDGRSTPRLARTVDVFRSAGFAVKAEPRMDAWLRTHAAFEVPLGQAVHTAGGPEALARDRAGIRAMIGVMRQNLGSLPTPIVPGAFRALRVVPEALLVPVFGAFLRSSAAGPLRTDSSAVTRELERLADQLQSSSQGDAEPLDR